MEIEPGFDGLIRMRELSPKHITKASEAVSVGDEVTVKVIHVDMDNKKLLLALQKCNKTLKKLNIKIS